MTATPTKPMTFAEYWPIYDGLPFELVDGQPVECPMPGAKHGRYGVNFVFELETYIRTNRTGRVSGWDNFAMTKQNPDTVRGADISYYSYDRVPADRELPGYTDADILPEFIAEINSPSNRPAEIRKKVDEYLAAGVQVVAEIDGDTKSVTIHRKGEIQQVFDSGDDLVIPDLFPGFRFPVKSLFV